MAFIPLCPTDAIGANTSKQFAERGVKLFVVNERGVFYAYRNRCPHLGIELQWQEDKFLDFDGEMIQCSTHGALFLMHSGECVAGPCRGKSLEAISCTVINQQVCVDLDELGLSQQQ
ncbi:Rieske (2Fe-2S) protein [Simiduia curdlanivorans]|uniref:Rieske (2Fe-2S) protein n=1 Tax=Simiduia curdlanivorans TaxID=1492769 RepID=A0ABV8V3S9_9GAMM|nr:Rieske (2Fe-2S) protein [Simiduia curdlanivorans]MDN3640856.1 Rieske (2Fe-2S) protein [Simiduia curdlanivorans]